MTCDTLEIEPHSLYESVFLYKTPLGDSVDLTGLVDDADFTIRIGDQVVWTGSVTSTDIQATLSAGEFVLLIPDTDVELFDFGRARYRFRLHWVTKGWQSIADGAVMMLE